MSSEETSEDEDETTTVTEEEVGEELVQSKNYQFKEDLYEFALCAIIRDVNLLSHDQNNKDPTKKHHKGLRIARIVFSGAMLAFNIALQIYIIIQVKRLVSARAVNNIRNVYSQYQETMYGKEHTYMTVNGKYRGLDGFFTLENFGTLDQIQKLQICQVSLSQPCFLAVVLFIWTLTCFGEIGTGLNLFYYLVVRLPTIDTMAEAVKLEEEVDEEGGTKVASLGRIVVGLTATMKAFVVVGVLFPMVGIACVLLWLGCRWLLATNNFASVMLNAVALEFIFLLKDLMYNTVISDRNKVDVERTTVSHGGHTHTTYVSVHSKSLWIVAALVWTLAYIYKMQVVLPGYNWDVHDVCQDFIGNMTAV